MLESNTSGRTPRKTLVLIGGAADYDQNLSKCLSESFQLIFTDVVAPVDLGDRMDIREGSLPVAIVADPGNSRSERDLEDVCSRFPKIPVLRLPLQNEASPGSRPELTQLESLLKLIDEAVVSVAQLRSLDRQPALSVDFPAPESLPAEITIGSLTRADSARWDAFVERHQDATFFHRSGWKRVLEEVYDHDAPFLYAEQDGEIVGILPLGHIESKLFGSSLCSTPFCVYGGVVASDPVVRDRLQLEACRLAEQLEVDHLELRYLKKTNPEWPRKELHVTFRKEIDSDPDVNMKAIPRKQRRMVRQGIDNGLVSEVDESPDRFFPVYAECVRNLGTPVHSKKYFKFLKDVFGDDCEVLSILHRGQVVSSVLSFLFKDQILPYYGGGGRAARELSANDFMYWELMRRSGLAGIRLFDFGRSKKGVGSYSFKKHWGFVEEPLNYEFHLLGGHGLPDINPLNPKYQLFIAAWKRLPLPLANAIGPVLAKDLG